MKLFAVSLIFSFAAASSAFAQSQTPPNQVQPVRLAKAHIVVNKVTFTPAPNPHTSDDVICDTTIDAPVFDVRGLVGPWWYQAATLECPSTVGGQPVVVHLYSSISISNRNTPSDATDRKYFASGLWVGTQAGVPLPPGDFSAQGVSAWSHDLNLKSMGLDLSPQVVWLCQDFKEEPFPQSYSKKIAIKEDNSPRCTPSLNEWFNASVEFVD